MQKVRLYRSRAVYFAAILASVALAVFIFAMSAEPANVSGDRSVGIADKIAPVIVENFEKLDKAEQVAVVESIEHIIRKIAHFCIYAALGGLILLASLWHIRTVLCHLSLSLLLSALYAASDEIHQYFVPGRGPLVSDVVLDSIGAFCGILFVYLAFKLFRKIKTVA